MRCVFSIIVSLLLSIGAYSQFLATAMHGGAGTRTYLIDSCFAYYSLEEAAGDALDLVGSNDLTPAGTVAQEETGKIGDCYSFTTDGTLGSIADEFDFSESFSISLWISTTSTTNLDGIVTDFDPTDADYGWALFTYGNPTRLLYWRFHYDGGSETVVGTTDINDGAWYHVAASYNHVDELNYITIFFT